MAEMTEEEILHSALVLREYIQQQQKEMDQRWKNVLREKQPHQTALEVEGAENSWVKRMGRI